MSAIVIPGTVATIVVEDTTVDLVCFEQAFGALRDRARAGKLVGYVEAVLEANPGLAGVGSVLPLGTRLVLPEFVVIVSTQEVRLWD